MANRRIAYVVNHAAFFVSHRMPLAIGAREAGFDPCLISGQPGSLLMEQYAVEKLRVNGLQHRRVLFTASGRNPFIEIIGLLQLVWYIFRFKPDIIHCASPKGALYGGIAARVCGVKALVIAISGMGYAYTGGDTAQRSRIWIRRIYDVMSNVAFRHPNACLIVQNRDDYAHINRLRLPPGVRIRLIPGSGVNISDFKDCRPSQKSKIIIMPARVLRDKGVVEFVEAARIVKAVKTDWRFVLAGAADYQNPSAIAQRDLLQWQSEGVIEWLGHVEGMVDLYREAAIVCLPSYREGMPKCLLEAAAAGCAVVTTDVPGCREAVEPGITGEIVPAKQSGLLAEALIDLISNDNKRLMYGINGQRRARELFSVDAVINTTLDIYGAVLENA